MQSIVNVSSGLFKGFIKSDSHSSNVNEVTWAVLNFFLQKDFARTQKKTNGRHQPKPTKKAHKDF